MYRTYTTSPYTTTTYAPSASTGLGLIGGVFVTLLILIILAWVILVIIAKWKIFKKAGQEGWKSMIPIYSEYTLLRILNMEPMLCFLTFITPANFFLNIVMMVKLAKSFKKETGFAIGLILLQPIFLMILGFGNAKYTQIPSSK